MRHDSHSLRQLLAPVVETLGYELVGVDFQPRAGNSLLRLYIDREGGVGLDDCQQVSHQVSGLLDVEEPITGHYTLEVSSPGLDRPLFDAEHFARFAGQPVRIRLRTPLAGGRRNLSGRLLGMRGDQVIVECQGEEQALPLADIARARLIPEF